LLAISAVELGDGLGVTAPALSRCPQRVDILSELGDVLLGGAAAVDSGAPAAEQQAREETSGGRESSATPNAISPVHLGPRVAR
jgi:hypothetical protein